MAPLYLAAFKRENGKMLVMKQGADEPNWYQKIVGNFAFPNKTEMHAPITATVGKFQLRSLSSRASLTGTDFFL